MDRAKEMAKFRKGFAQGAVITLDEQPDISVISTGIITLDEALRTGGWARGAMHMVWGPPSGGKTAISLLTMADLMERDPNALVAVIDIEDSFRKEWVSAFGIDTERVVIMPAITTEEAVNMFQETIRSGLFDFIVIDSLGALARQVEVYGKTDSKSKKKEDEQFGDANDAVYSGSAALISRWVRIGSSELKRLKREIYCGEEKILPVVYFIQQQRADLDSQYNPFKFNGGEALKHMMSSIVKVSPRNGAENIVYGSDASGAKCMVGQLVVATVEKNKFAPKNKQAGYIFVHQPCPEHEFGVDKVRAAFDIAVTYGIVQQAGAYYRYPVGEEVHQEQGKDNFMSWLKANPDVLKEIRTKVLQIVSGELVEGVNVNDESA